MKNRHNFEFSPKTMLVFLTIICILLLSVSAVLKNAVKPLSAVAETVVIATGVNRNKPNMKGLQEFEGKGVSYCAVCDAPFIEIKM